MRDPISPPWNPNLGSLYTTHDHYTRLTTQAFPTKTRQNQQTATQTRSKPTGYQLTVRLFEQNNSLSSSTLELFYAFLFISQLEKRLLQALWKKA